MTIVSLNLEARAMEIAGVGNVECHLWTPEREQMIVTQRGILGFTLPTIRPVQLSIEGPWIIVLHSDGVSARFKVAQYVLSPADETSLHEAASQILADHARAYDDATVVIVAPTPPLTPTTS